MKALKLSIQSINEFKDIIQAQSEALQSINENMRLLSREIIGLQKKVYALNTRLVEIEEWRDENESKL